MRADVRPRNEIGRHYVSFGVTFVILHQIVNTLLDHSSISSTTSLGHVTSNNARTCVGIDGNGIPCGDDPGSREASGRPSRRRDATYYLLNFGVRQSLDGNDEERVAIREVALRTEDYMRRWIVKYDHDESSKEIW
jgi:hypothetical protein